jgi:hypothetical protein
MPRAPKSHYMVDVFRPEPGRPDGFPAESYVIKASSETEAVQEAKATVAWHKPAYFHVRKIARSGESVIYRSEDAKMS